MGVGFAKLTRCCSAGGVLDRRRRRHDSAAVVSDPYDDGLGHSFCYVRPDPIAAAAEKVEEATTFRSISGASVGANAFTPLSTSSLLNDLTWPSAASAFESSDSFSAVPLQPAPRLSGPLSGPLADPRGFLSGPIERGFMSGPLDARASLFSGPLDEPLGRRLFRRRRAAASILRGLSRAISRNILPRPTERSHLSDSSADSTNSIGEPMGADELGAIEPARSSLQWAQGKAGEDRVHVVVSEEHGWLFVGIYDGFNGPDATDFLLSNLYSAIHTELKGLLWDDKSEYLRKPSDDSSVARENSDGTLTTTTLTVETDEGVKSYFKRRRLRGPAKKWEEKQRMWKCEWDHERLKLDRRLREQRTSSGNVVKHHEVLKALCKALKQTDDAYLDTADRMMSEHPELALMGSCVLVMLMKGDDVYLMNVGDSRAVLARTMDPDLLCLNGRTRQDLERIKEESQHDLESTDSGDGMNGLALPSLSAFQLTPDHSTRVAQEVNRIRNEHRDDASAVVRDRVKGSLKVTRAFGAGYLKQPKWNNALLDVFRIDYVGTLPYITCSPFLYHHRLGPKDRFLILSSDGLYEYFTNKEAVSTVEMFIEINPEGDPAQHLVEEVLLRAAKKAGMDFHELLKIPQGERRQYHDDVSIIVVSLEGRIWRSSV